MNRLAADLQHVGDRLPAPALLTRVADLDRLEAIGAKAYADNEVVDVNLIDAEVVDGVVEPVRLREKIRAAGPTIRGDLGKQAERAA